MTREAPNAPSSLRAVLRADAHGVLCWELCDAPSAAAHRAGPPKAPHHLVSERKASLTYMFLTAPV